MIVSMGDAKDQILDCAENMKVDMLIVGSYSKGPLKRAFLGSVGDHLCHHSSCPVLVIRNTPPAANAAKLE